MRRFILSIVVLAGLLVAVDRVGLVLAERDVAHRIQADQHLSATPDVTIHGFPFLTQLFGGTYDDVDITARGLREAKVKIPRIDVHLQGTHVSLADVLTQHISRIRIDRAEARLVETFADLKIPAPLRRDMTATVTGPTTVTLRDSEVSGAVTSNAAISLTLTKLPFDIHFESVKVTQTGLVITGSADGLVVHT